MAMQAVGFATQCFHLATHFLQITPPWDDCFNESGQVGQGCNYGWPGCGTKTIRSAMLGWSVCCRLAAVRFCCRLDAVRVCCRLDVVRVCCRLDAVRVCCRLDAVRVCCRLDAVKVCCRLDAVKVCCRLDVVRVCCRLDVVRVCCRLDVVRVCCWEVAIETESCKKEEQPNREPEYFVYNDCDYKSITIKPVLYSRVQTQVSTSAIINLSNSWGQKRAGLSD